MKTKQKNQKDGEPYNAKVGRCKKCGTIQHHKDGKCPDWATKGGQ